jgi:hypothetical protein
MDVAAPGCTYVTLIGPTLVAVASVAGIPVSVTIPVLAA